VKNAQQFSGVLLPIDAEVFDDLPIGSLDVGVAGA
jgi:hypothetical protein